MSAALALRAALRTKLLADSALVTILGGNKVYDEVPRGEATPFIVLDDTESRDASADEAPAEEHRIALAVWSRQAGLSEALRAAARIAAQLDGASLTLTGHRLVNLRWQSTEGRRVDDRYRLAVVRLRALTEPL